MSTRARLVVRWIDELERRPDLDEWFDDVIADDRLAPGRVFAFTPQPLLPLDLDVFSAQTTEKPAP
jgi:hypothetical protein